jgi:hypothetical protein
MTRKPKPRPPEDPYPDEDSEDLAELLDAGPSPFDASPPEAMPPTAPTACAPPPAPQEEPATLTAAAGEAHALLLLGHQFKHLREWARATHPHLDADAVIEGARDLFRASASEPPEVLLGFVLDALRDIYRRQIDIGDFASARATLHEIASVLKEQKVARPKATAAHPTPPTPADRANTTSLDAWLNARRRTKSR